IAISAGSAVSTSWSAEKPVGMKKSGAMLDLSQIARLWSNLHLGSYLCMLDLLTTDGAATYLPLSQRKLYELLSLGDVPMYPGHGTLVVCARRSRPMGDGRADHIGGPRTGCGAANRWRQS